MPAPTTSTRLDEHTDRLVSQSAERRGVTRAVWIRETIEAAIEAEELAAEQAPTLTGMDKRLTSLEGDLRETLKISRENSRLVNELSDTLAIERAANRAVAQQIYRMALRSSLLCVKIIVDGVPEDEQAGLGAELSKQADDVFEDAGLTRLDQVMRDAREEMRQSIERGGAP